MNDRYDAGYEGQYELVGYDAYGQPVYRQVPPPQQSPQQPYDPYAPYGQQGQGFDPYATGAQHQGQDQQQPAPGHDPYGTGQQPPVPPQDGYDTTGAYPAYDTYGTYDGYDGYDGYAPYGQTAAGGQQPRVAEQTAYIPQQAGPPAPDPGPGAQDPDADPAPDDGRDHRTGQFAFVEEPDGDSEDVIDWLAFTENRTERREEAKRRARGRLVALVVVLAVFAAGGVGYLWYAGKLPGLSSSDGKNGGTTAAGAQKRDVIVVHLHDTKGGGTSTALLVDNTTTKRGTTVLLPNTLALSGDDGSATTLTKSVKDDGSSGTREALDTALGTSIQGTWRLDTPYLQNLVDLVGNIEVDTDTDVPDPDAEKGGAPLVREGEKQTLSGKNAVAYATYKASGEKQEAQLERFGQVMQGVLRKMSSDPEAATTTVQTLAQILDPSLTDQDLGTFLAALSDLAKSGDHTTTLLPVEPDGTLNAQTGAGVVKDVLGGTAKNPEQGSAVRVSVQNATGAKDRTDNARVALLNGGFTFLEGGTAGTAQPTSKVTYGEAADKENATEVAKTLGLPDSAVTQGDAASHADVSVVLGQDYEPADP
ncbi:LytR C-terminal domain-containing protein [Streptomyces sp. NPDC088789]|uniref:LytR C-terminal domain-containing protein n=1 Tax=Streptomyces sp. NPDC088789 TaxID=3365899 RepID=UPI003827FB26